MSYIKKRGKKASAAQKKAKSSGASGVSSDHGFNIPGRATLERKLGDYHLMEAVGKGGFGVVYRAVNVDTGACVAVKRVTLLKIPQEELEGIKMEIQLLQNLAHPNIVSYISSIQTKEHLNIILEFVENGALSNLINKFDGHLPESLCKVYIKQTLQGLKYLHDQGVIHRDIKGANILSTKDGCIKLADFGVATKLNDTKKSDSVVGTPYWMAPEIIEMTGQQSSACDIWSVGCVVVELLTGKPPYFDLQQMAALFRIVQDEHPPLPDNISPALEDFLLQCFQKDPKLRVTANALLKHPWLKGVDGPEGKQQESEMNRLTRQLLRASVQGRSGSADLRDGSFGGDEDWKSDDRGSNSGNSDDGETIIIRPGAAGIPGLITLSHASASNGALLDLQEDSEEDPFAGMSDDDEDWNGMLNAGSNSIAEPERGTKESVRPDDLDDLDDMSDDTGDFDNVAITSHDTSHNVANKLLAPPGHVNSSKSPDGCKHASGGSVNMVNMVSTSAGGLINFIEDDDDDANYEELFSGGGSKRASGRVDADGDDGDIDWGDDDDDDQDDLDGIDLESRLEQTKTRIWDDAEHDGEGEDVNVFDGITFDDMGAETAQDAQTARTFDKIIIKMKPSSDEETVTDACKKLSALATEHPAQIRDLICQGGGVIPLMEMLEVTNPRILHAVLQVINLFVREDQKFQQNMSLVGLVPILIRFAGPAYPTIIRMEACSFIRIFCYASDFTRKMFVACGGLPTLVNFLKEDYISCKTLVWNAIDCIRHVFDITSSPKNDFCRLFCKFGLLEPLTDVLKKVHRDSSSTDASPYVEKIGEILHLFSHGDSVVRAHFAEPSVLQSMLEVLPSLEQKVLILLLKSFRNISMDPRTLDLLEEAGAIPALISFLNSAPENQSQVLACMYDLCKIKSSRQEQAVVSGIIPHLQRIIRSNLPTRQFAFPIIILLAKTSSRNRQTIKKYSGIQFFADILEDPYWRIQALEVLSVWLTEDAHRVAFHLNTTTNVNRLIRLVQTTSNVMQVEQMLPTLCKILNLSISLNRALGRSDAFVRELLARLHRHADSNVIRVTLLRILGLLIVAHQAPRTFIEHHGLMELLNRVASQKDAVLLMDMAQKLVTKCQDFLAPAQSSTTPSTASKDSDGSQPVASVA